MIAIDTNVLLRYLLGDDESQAEKAAKLITGKELVLITDVVLVETIWTLKGKKYQLKKSELAAVIQALFKEPNIRFEDGQIVWLALNDYRKAKPVKGKEADFSDALIVQKAKFMASAQKVDFGGVYTFDVAAQKLPNTTAPK
jgi:predicted nucleic-acid-binding protein